MKSRPAQVNHGQSRAFYLAAVALATFGGGVVALRAQQPAAAKPPPPVMTMLPGELLKLMPSSPDGWKLVASSGQNDLTDSLGTETFAVRDYVDTKPPPTPPTGVPSAPPLPAKTRLTLIDTGFDPSALAGFTNFKPETTAGEGNIRRFLMEGHPATLVVRSSGKQVLKINLASRFLAIVELENQPETAQKFWVDLLNLPSLTQAATTAPREPIPPRKVRLVHVDELNPQSNSARIQPYVTAEEAEEYNKRIQGGPVAHPPSR